MDIFLLLPLPNDGEPDPPIPQISQIPSPRPEIFLSPPVFCLPHTDLNDLKTSIARVQFCSLAQCPEFRPPDS